MYNLKEGIDFLISVIIYIQGTWIWTKNTTNLTKQRCQNAELHGDYDDDKTGLQGEETKW